MLYTKNHRGIRVGDTLIHKNYGKGKCTKLDLKSKDFRYLFKFEDGTIAWLSDEDCKKVSAY